MGTIENSDKELERLRKEKLKKYYKNLEERGGKLKEKIVIPAEDGNGLNARLSEHFGRAPYFIIV